MPIQIKTIPPNILDLLCSKQPNFFPKKTPMRQRINVMTEMAEMEHIIWIKVSAPTAEGKITPVANASLLVATAIASNVFVFRVLFSQKAASSFFQESQIILIPR